MQGVTWGEVRKRIAFHPLGLWGRLNVAAPCPLMSWREAPPRVIADKPLNTPRKIERK